MPATSRAASISIGEQVEARLADLPKELGAVASAVEDDRRSHVGADGGAHLGEQLGHSARHRCIALGDDDEHRGALLVAHPVVGRRRQRDAHGSDVCLAELLVAEVGAHVAVDVEEGDGVLHALDCAEKGTQRIMPRAAASAGVEVRLHGDGGTPLEFPIKVFPHRLQRVAAAERGCGRVHGESRTLMFRKVRHATRLPALKAGLARSVPSRQAGILLEPRQRAPHLVARNRMKRGM